jgi:quinoprotein dehydrogenase-associated probable ABC transporter substrate-binding protein
MRTTDVMSKFAASVLVLACASFAATSTADTAKPDEVLRVCADPDNLPLSNDHGEGYENKIAEQLARDLGRKLEYTYFPQRMGFVRNTLRQRDPQTQQFKCDVIIGVPKGYELTATTAPYMRSTYALIFKHRSELENIARPDDLLALPADKLKSLRIGVFGQSPGADWLLRNGLIEQGTFFAAQSGDPHENPAHTIERELDAGNIDMAIVWGPIAGHLVRKHASFPTWRAVAFEPDPAIKFDYEISMGVRFGEKEWQATLDDWIAKHQREVREILDTYRVPILDANGKVVTALTADDKARANGIPKRIPLDLNESL